MEKPMVQIDDELREMTDEEYEQHLINIGQAQNVVAN